MRSTSRPGAPVGYPEGSKEDAPPRRRTLGTPFLSVIVPVFSSPEFLETCLLSIRKSSFDGYEILIADDASRDAAAIRETAIRYGARVIRLERNSGPAAARNRAAK